ncbi:hypothetical protein BDB01DRAFT_849508 [Pilobolus umbonatus]|nr:hypothetical protein BDB01DRAFT_849508 [Pilobolus umbonatus]
MDPHEYSKNITQPFLKDFAPFKNKTSQQASATSHTRKLSNIMHILKQQSTKHRFKKDWDKMNTVLDINTDMNNATSSEYPDNVSERVIDRGRLAGYAIDIRTPGNNNRPEKKPKRVQINEDANEIQRVSEETVRGLRRMSGDYPVESFIKLESALSIIQENIMTMNKNIEEQTRRIQSSREQITLYKQLLVDQDKEMDALIHSLSAVKDDCVHMSNLKTARINEIPIGLEKKKKEYIPLLIKIRKYQKAIVLDTHLTELNTKIKTAQYRDKLWADIRSWAFVSALSLLFFIMGILTYRRYHYG